MKTLHIEKTHKREAYKKEIKSLLEEAEKTKNTKAVVRELAKRNLFFLCYYLMDMNYIDNDFAFDFCAEIDKKCFGRMWICAREHYKSTFLSFAFVIQCLIRNPEERIGIYAYNANLAESCLQKIRTELEINEKLKYYFDDIFYKNPQKESPLWRADSLLVKRNSRARESSIECSGLITGQKTGRHYTIGIYDDCVTPDSVLTSDAINHVIKTWQISLNTLTSENLRYVVLGTYYHYDDLYCYIKKNQIMEIIEQPCIDENGEPVLLTKEALEFKRKSMGSAVFASQMLCDPKEARKDTFKREWLRKWSCQNLNGMNIYMFVDPAGDKGRKRDYTAIWTIGYTSDGNYMVIDLIRDKLSLRQRIATIFSLHRTYHPIMIFYEKVGMQADIDAIELEQERKNYRFDIFPVKSTISKDLRIQSLSAPLENGKFYFPPFCKHKNWEEETEDMLDTFLNDEYDKYPFCSHDDAIDSLAMTQEQSVKLNAVFPSEEEAKNIVFGMREKKLKKIIDYEPLDFDFDYNYDN